MATFARFILTIHHNLSLVAIVYGCRQCLAAPRCGRTFCSPGGVSSVGQTSSLQGQRRKSARSQCERAALPLDAGGGDGPFRKGASAYGPQVAVSGWAVC